MLGPYSKRPDPKTGAITQYFITDTFNRQDMLTAYAARADFKFEMYGSATTVDQGDSYFVLGSGIDTIDKVIALFTLDRRAYAIITDGVGLVLKLDMADMQFIRQQFVALYGAVTKPAFEDPAQQL